jgi:(p)ppGpp synthase/HD superfamily hydrolase
MRFQRYIKEQYLIELSIGMAAKMADDLHQGQFRKDSGEPYIVHPVGTYKILKTLGIKDREVLTAALFHDTLEDTNINYNEIKRKLNKRVADLVKEVTSDKKAIEKTDKPNYLVNKMVKMSDDALLIKLADRLHNLSDITTVNKKFAEKMYNQTTFIIQELREKRSLNNKHKKLIRLINKQLDKYEK